MQRIDQNLNEPSQNESGDKVVSEYYPAKEMMFTLIDKRDLDPEGPAAGELVLESISSDEDEP